MTHGGRDRFEGPDSPWDQPWGGSRRHGGRGPGGRGGWQSNWQGGPPPWEVFEAHRLGRDAPSDAVMPVVAALAGFFVHRSTLPPPPGLPTLREFQRGQGIEALAWLRHGLDES